MHHSPYAPVILQVEMSESASCSSNVGSLSISARLPSLGRRIVVTINGYLHMDDCSPHYYQFATAINICSLDT